MLLSADRAQPMRRRLRLTVAAQIAAGCGLTLLIFYPGGQDLRRKIRLRGHR
jgi:hypothetical protein